MLGVAAVTRSIIPRSVAKIVEASEKNATRMVYTMHASYVEIYNEQVRRLSLKFSQKHSSCTRTVLRRLVALLEAIDSVDLPPLVDGVRGSSRRSHEHERTVSVPFVFMSTSSVTTLGGSQLTGCLNLVDLAVPSASVDLLGHAIEGACAINKSLSSLGDVFQPPRQAHVPSAT